LTKTHVFHGIKSPVKRIAARMILRMKTASWRLGRTFHSSQGHIRYDILGSGPPLVLVHGTPSWSYVWRDVAPRLANKFQVFVYDLAGYGHSEQHAAQDLRLRAHARTLAELLRHWNLDAPHLIGHDFGGATVMGAHLVEGAPVSSITVADAVVLNPWGTPYAQLVKKHPEVFTALPEYVHLAMVASHLYTAIHKSTTREDLEPYLAPWSGAAGQRAYVRTFEQFDQEYTARLETLYPQLAVPVQVVWGEADRWIDVSVAHRLHDMIPGSQLDLIPNAGHFLTEDAPGAFANVVEAFLRPL
jgi:pimeloyl-ACP methyl ester carboxylesterase